MTDRRNVADGEVPGRLLALEVLLTRMLVHMPGAVQATVLDQAHEALVDMRSRAVTRGLFGLPRQDGRLYEVAGETLERIASNVERP